MTTVARDQLDAPPSAPRRLVVAAGRLDHPDLVRVVAAWCALGAIDTAALVVATDRAPEEVAEVLLSACAHLDLGAAGPIELLHIDEVAPLAPGELSLFLGGGDAGPNLEACLAWIASLAARPVAPAPVRELDVSAIAAAIAAVTPSAPTTPTATADPAPAPTPVAPRPAAVAGASTASFRMPTKATHDRASSVPAPPPAPSPAPAPARPAARRRATPPPLAVVLGHPAEEGARRAHLETEVGTERQTLRRLGAPAGLDALARVAEVCRPLDWIDGYLSLADALFLYDVVAGTRPTRVLEIGSASGYSAAVILRALADAGVPLVAADGRPAVLSYDIATHCYWNASRPVGSAVAELVPELAHGARFVQGTSLDASTLPVGSASMAFIDANHDHPWATLDLLLVSRVLRPGSWVVLHDTQLAACGRLYADRTGTGAVWNQHGASHLFETWPFERLTERASDTRNIGAVRTPLDRSLGIDDVYDSLAREWETQVPEPVLAAVRAIG